MQTQTEFKPIPAFPDYEVSRRGEVRRRTSKGGWKGKRGAWPPGRPGCSRPHHRQKLWYLWRDGVETVLTTAQIVGSTFGVPRSDLVDYAKGERVRSAKLTAEDIPQIRAMYKSGIPTEHIGQTFGVAGRTIRDIRAGKNWKHIP